MEADITTSGSEGLPPLAELRCPDYPPPLDNATAALIVCKFYKGGCCRRGTSCRFIHPTDGESGSIMRDGSGKSTPSGVAAAPGAGTTAAAATQTRKPDATATSAKGSLIATSLDPSKWINAPVFVPKSRMADETCPKLHGTAGGAYAGAETDADADADAEADVDADDDTEQEYADDENEETPSVPESEDGAGARGMSYASIVKANNSDNEYRHGLGVASASAPLCPYYEEHGRCTMPDCKNKHGQKCDLCERYCMHPDDAEQRQMHTAHCIKQHELDMEHSFAIQRSFDKTCGICLEVILEKRARERRFGILPNCKHIFCLSCIRTWRKANNFENKIKRGCPTCRIASDFVCPSYVWIESDEEKKKLIDDYKLACNATDCMHFKKGAAKCPFGNKCFYRHALVTGELIDVGAPPRRRERTRRRTSQGFRLDELFEQFLGPAMMLDEHGVTFLTDDEDSDYDDFDHLTYDVEMNYVLQDGIPSLDSLDSDDELLLSYFGV